MRHPVRTLAIGLAGLALATSVVAQQQAPTIQDRVNMLKSWLQASQYQLRNYEWIETTSLTKGGDEKAHKQNQVYYGVDGQLVKVPVGEQEEKKGGPKLPIGRLAAKHAKENMQEYMHQVQALVQSYLPPDPQRIQAAVDGGRFAANILEPGKRVRLDFHDYLKPGDTLGVEINVQTNQLLGMSVNSHLDDPPDPVSMQVGMGLLPDGTIFTQSTVLDAPGKDVRVTIENSGHRRTGG